MSSSVLMPRSPARLTRSNIEAFSGGSRIPTRWRRIGCPQDRQSSGGIFLGQAVEMLGAGARAPGRGLAERQVDEVAERGNQAVVIVRVFGLELGDVGGLAPIEPAIHDDGLERTHRDAGLFRGLEHPGNIRARNFALAHILGSQYVEMLVGGIDLDEIPFQEFSVVTIGYLLRLSSHGKAFPLMAAKTAQKFFNACRELEGKGGTGLFYREDGDFLPVPLW